MGNATGGSGGAGGSAVVSAVRRELFGHGHPPVIATGGHVSIGGAEAKWGESNVLTRYPYTIGDRVTSRQLQTGRAYVYEVHPGGVTLRHLPKRPSRGWARHVRRQKAVRR